MCTTATWGVEFISLELHIVQLYLKMFVSYKFVKKYEDLSVKVKYINLNEVKIMSSNCIIQLQMLLSTVLKTVKVFETDCNNFNYSWHVITINYLQL